MSTDERHISLRVKVPEEDGAAVMEMTGPAAPENGLQAFGDWVLAAVEQQADGAAEAARRMIAALRERYWEGDDVLADQLDALLESGAMPYLRPLPVDLDELAGILEGDPMYGGGRVDLATGEVWPAPAVDYAREIGQEDEDESDDPDKWLWVHCEGSRDGYWDMELFIGTVRDPGRADRLEIDEALCCLWERVPGTDVDDRLAAIRSSGHPAAAEVAGAVADLIASGVPLTIDQAMQLKVQLKYFKPPIWRSVAVPSLATPGDLHRVIQIVFGWDGDHLHAFGVGGRNYSDPSFGLEETGEEEDVRLRDAFRGKVTVGYEYDFGASWQHEITLQKVLPLDPRQPTLCAWPSRASPRRNILTRTWAGASTSRTRWGPSTLDSPSLAAQVDGRRGRWRQAGYRVGFQIGA